VLFVADFFMGSGLACSKRYPDLPKTPSQPAGAMNVGGFSILLRSDSSTLLLRRYTHETAFLQKRRLLGIGLNAHGEQRWRAMPEG
jgi:hypothetical protein